MTTACHMARCHALTIHNHEAPVSKLPMELLSEIFHIGLDKYDLDDYHAIKYPSAISSICSNWRDTALGTPSLWRCIIYRDDEHYHDQNPHLKTESPTIPRHTIDHLIAYLSRSKSRSIHLHLRFGASPLRIQAMKSILYPPLSRCLSIWLRFASKSNMGDFFPLPGNLCLLTEFNCSGERDWSYFGRSRCAPLPIFAEPESVSLQKLILDCCRNPPDNINVQDIEDVRLGWICNSWCEGVTFLSRCHSLTTLIITELISFGPEQPPFTLPHLTYLHTVGFAMLKVACTPNLRMLVHTDIYGDEPAGDVVRLPSLPALTTLCYMRKHDL